MKEKRSFDDTMHLYGRIFMTIGGFIIMAIPFVFAAVFDAKFNMPALISASISMCIVFLPSGIIDVMTYAPMLGTGASYLAFVTGNLINLKIPCVMNARELVGAEVGTPESELVSMLSVATSAIVTTFVITLGVVLLVPLTPIIGAPVLQPAFKNVIFALFGALGFQHFTKIPKVAVVPFVLLSVLYFVFPSLGGQTGVLVPIATVVTIIVAKVLYDRGEI